MGKLNYGVALFRVVKMVESLVPMAVTPVTITTAIRPAISAYSMTVAPLFSVLSSRTRDRAAWE